MRLSRREFLVSVGMTGASLVTARVPARAADADPLLAGRPLVRYPEKADLILLTARPPQLETPMRYFDRAITPNDAFFVRYHVVPIPTLPVIRCQKLNQYASLTSSTFRGGSAKIPAKSRPNRKSPYAPMSSRDCCDSTKSVDPGRYSQRITLVVLKDL